MRLYFDKDGKMTPIPDETVVVRCKDCKHYEPDNYFHGHGDCNGACDNLVKVSDNWFCADGERKDTL